MKKMEVKLIVGNRAQVIDIDKLLGIDNTDLITEYSRQAATYAFYASMVAEANHEVAKAKTNKEEAYAEISITVRMEFEKDEIKATEPRIKAETTIDGDYADAVNAFNEAKHNADTLSAITKALEMRADMLISMGAHMRHEMGMTGMNIKYDSTVDKLKEKLRRDQQKRSES